MSVLQQVLGASVKAERPTYYLLSRREKYVWGRSFTSATGYILFFPKGLVQQLMTRLDAVIFMPVRLRLVAAGQGWPSKRARQSVWSECDNDIVTS